jgi:hypothetical protein
MRRKSVWSLIRHKIFHTSVQQNPQNASFGGIIWCQTETSSSLASFPQQTPSLKNLIVGFPREQAWLHLYSMGMMRRRHCAQPGKYTKGDAAAGGNAMSHDAICYAVRWLVPQSNFGLSVSG